MGPGDKRRAPKEQAKKPYTKPAFWFERVFVLARFQRETLATSALNHPNVNPGRGGIAWA